MHVNMSSIEVGRSAVLDALMEIEETPTLSAGISLDDFMTWSTLDLDLDPMDLNAKAAAADLALALQVRRTCNLVRHVVVSLSGSPGYRVAVGR